MSDADDWWTSIGVVLVLAVVVVLVVGVASTCGDVSDLKRSVCALNYHAVTTASDSPGVQRSSGCPLPSTTKDRT